MHKPVRILQWLVMLLVALSLTACVQKRTAVLEVFVNPG
jgi:hypothetical protein